MTRARAASFCCPRAVAVTRADANLYRAAAVAREATHDLSSHYRSPKETSETSEDCQSFEQEESPRDDIGSHIADQSCISDRVAADLALCRGLLDQGNSVASSRRNSRLRALPEVPLRRRKSVPEESQQTLVKQAHDESRDSKRPTHVEPQQLEKDLRQAQLRCEDERRRFEEEKASYVEEAHRRFEDERQRLAEEKASYLKELEEERLRVMQNAERQLEEERQRILKEAESKLESELSRARLHRPRKVKQGKSRELKELPICRPECEKENHSGDDNQKINDELDTIGVPLLDKQNKKLESESRQLAQEAERHKQELEEKRLNEVQGHLDKQQKKLEAERQQLAQEAERYKYELEEERRKWAQELEDKQRKKIEAERQQFAEEAERHKQGLEEERHRLAQELEYNRQALNDRLQDERVRLAAEIKEKQKVIEENLKQEHSCEMEAAKLEKQKLLEDVKRAAESQAQKITREKQLLKEERKAFEEEKARFLDEKNRLQAEFQRLQEAVKAERLILSEAEKRRRAEEKILAETLKQHKALQTVASLTTVDHSAAVDPSLTDIKERAMAKATALSKHIGSVVFRLLFDEILGKLNSEDAALFQKELASGGLLDVESTAICTPEPESYGELGGKPYFKPAGWIRCGLSKVPSGCEDWCVAYHGTTDSNALRIMLHGLKRPGEAGVRVAHGQMHSETGASIYLSPSIEYAAFPCYSQIFKLGEEHWAQLVLECRVRPGSFKQADGTLSSNKHWPGDVWIDSNFKGLAGLEWLLEGSDDVVVSALMIREFGQKADASIYGPLVTRIKSPEYLWTELRVEEARANQSSASRG